MKCRTLGLLAAVLGFLAPARTQLARDYVLELLPESEPDREARHQWVAQRRAGPAVIVHRGATAAAPENTLLACSTAMDWGADGVEVDVRRTRDGILVLFHDDMLDRLTHGIGEVGQLTASELLALPHREAFGRPASGSVPSFVQLLDLARQRAVLLHLDVKEPGLDDDLARWLEAADCWDHVVAVNADTAPQLARDPRIRGLRYKVAGLYADRQDMDPEAVRAALREPGELLMVDDPRVAAWILQRPNYRPVPLLRTFRISARPAESRASTQASGFDPSAHLAGLPLRVNPDSPLSLLGMLRAPFPEAGDLAVEVALQDRRAARIVERAWAADRLGGLGRRHRDVVSGLEDTVRARTPHPDWRYHALDGALAARALGRLGAKSSAPVLVEAFRDCVPPAGLSASGSLAAYPRSWLDARFKLHLLPALADLRCGASRRFLEEYLALDDARARAYAPPMFEEATRAFLRQSLDRQDLLALLQHDRGAIRGTAVQECLDQSDPDRRAALRLAAPWTGALPVARTLPPLPAKPPPRVRAGVTASPKGAP